MTTIVRPILPWLLILKGSWEKRGRLHLLLADVVPGLDSVRDVAQTLVESGHSVQVRSLCDLNLIVAFEFKSPNKHETGAMTSFYWLTVFEMTIQVIRI